MTAIVIPLTIPEPLLACRRSAIRFVVTLLTVVTAVTGVAQGQFTYQTGTPDLGAHYDASGANIRFVICSSRATRVDLYLYSVPSGSDEQAVVPLQDDSASGRWSASVSVNDLKSWGITGTVYYGFRAWGGNWPYDPAWKKGSSAGFASDCDGDGNRFNPNKLLLDPYAAEISHDPTTVQYADGSVYGTGVKNRVRDSGQVAPKGIVLPPDLADVGPRPTRAFRDEIIYEVHVRGLTREDPLVANVNERGTYRGAAQRADYLKGLGVTAVEFLPVQEFNNDRNDVDLKSAANDYWGYDTLGYFAPDRRYSSDKSAGGPTREFKAMVRAFHEHGIKVYLDVVFNHTGEGSFYNAADPTTINVLSWRGLDNPTYYELVDGNQYYYDNTGVTQNFNCANPVVRNFIIDSLRYWSLVMGVDGFRFDLAPVLGNSLDHQLPANGAGFIFDKMPANNPLNRAVRELPVRPADGGMGVDLIAEPWNASGDGGQQQGNFPSGWAEWNDHFRDTFRKSQNRLGVENVTPSDLATRFAGSRDLYQDDGRKPWHSINFLVAHDGPCLRDMYAFNIDSRRAWDQGGDAVLQRQADRNGFAFPLVSAGVPMFTAGDEFYRSQGGNDNAYNVDNENNYLNWTDVATNQKYFDFARRIIAFRNSHPALRPAEYFDGNDHNGNGLKDITWYRDDAQEPDNNYWNALDRHFLAFRIDGTERGDPADSIYVGYNGWSDPVTITLPAPLTGRAWYRSGDTSAWMEADGNFKDAGTEDHLIRNSYELKGRALLILIEH